MTREEVRQETYRIIKREARITDYAGKLGFTLIRKGKYYSLKEHDSVIIDPWKNCFWRNSRPGTGKAIGKGGSVIDFLCEFTDLSLHEVLTLLSGDVNALDRLPRFEKRREDGKDGKGPGLQLPRPDSHMHNVYAYLVKTRKIRADVVQKMVDARQLYQDTHKNCVFVSYDLQEKDKPVFGCRRGTNTYHPFYGDLLGNDYSQCFHIGQGASRIYVTEGVIDALSVMSLRSDADHFNYLALTGVGKTDCIFTYLENPKIQEIWIGTDRDEAGREAAGLLEEKIKSRRPDIRIVMDLPDAPHKDWNDVLKNREG